MSIRSPTTRILFAVAACLLSRAEAGAPGSNKLNAYKSPAGRYRRQTPPAECTAGQDPCTDGARPAGQPPVCSDGARPACRTAGAGMGQGQAGQKSEGGGQKPAGAGGMGEGQAGQTSEGGGQKPAGAEGADTNTTKPAGAKGGMGEGGGGQQQPAGAKGMGQGQAEGGGQKPAGAEGGMGQQQTGAGVQQGGMGGMGGNRTEDDRANRDPFNVDAAKAQLASLLKNLNVTVSADALSLVNAALDTLFDAAEVAAAAAGGSGEADAMLTYEDLFQNAAVVSALESADVDVAAMSAALGVAFDGAADGSLEGNSAALKGATTTVFAALASVLAAVVVV